MVKNAKTKTRVESDQGNCRRDTGCPSLAETLSHFSHRKTSKEFFKKLPRDAEHAKLHTARKEFATDAQGSM